MYFIVIQHPMKNTSICTNSVALMFIMGTPLRQCRTAKTAGTDGVIDKKDVMSQAKD